MAPHSVHLEVLEGGFLSRGRSPMLEDGLGGIRSRKHMIQDGRPFYERWPLQHSQGRAAHGHGDPRCWWRQVQPSISAILSLLRFTAMRECLLTGPASRLGKLMRAETIEQVNEQEVDLINILRFSSSAMSLCLEIHQSFSLTATPRTSPPSSTSTGQDSST